MGGDQSNNAEDKSSERQKRGNLPSPSGEVWSAVATAALGWGPRGGAPHTAAPGLRDGRGGFPPPECSSTRQIQAGGGAPDDQRSNTKGGGTPPGALPYIDKAIN